MFMILCLKLIYTAKSFDFVFSNKNNHYTTQGTIFSIPTIPFEKIFLFLKTAKMRCSPCSCHEITTGQNFNFFFETVFNFTTFLRIDYKRALIIHSYVFLMYFFNFILMSPNNNKKINSLLQQCPFELNELFDYSSEALLLR